MPRLELVKLGGSVITEKAKPYTARSKTIARLAGELHSAHARDKGMRLIVGHGGGSFPHTSAVKYQTHKGILGKQGWKGFSLVHNDAARLNEIMVNALLQAGENAFPIQPSAGALARNGRIVSWDASPVKKMLEANLTPVPYGDVGLDLSKGCCILSTEEVLGYLGKKLKAKRMIAVANVDGVLTEERDLVGKITPNNFAKISRHLGGSGAADVTGGMRQKVNALLELAKAGMDCLIINGNEEGLLEKALEGKRVTGTRIVRR